VVRNRCYGMHPRKPRVPLLRTAAAAARARARARVALRVPWPSEWNCSVLIEKFKRDFVSG